MIWLYFYLIGGVVSYFIIKKTQYRRGYSRNWADVVLSFIFSWFVLLWYGLCELVRVLEKSKPPKWL